MKYVSLLAFGLFLTLSLFAQEKQPVFKGIFQAPLYKEIKHEDMQKPQWHVSFEFLYKKGKSDLLNTKSIRSLKTLQKRKSSNTEVVQPEQERKVRSTAPTIGTNFKGNELKSWTPTDNTIAVSDSGYMVSCVNWGIEYYDTAGNVLLLNQTWDGFVNDTTLNQAKFDPRVIYDPKNKKFVLVLLHGFSSASNKILIYFSKTANPVDGWNMYALSGNPYQDTGWTDFPVIGLNDDDLFIAGNRFGDAPSYSWKGAYIYQISMENGYLGNALDYGLWNNIYAPDGEEGLTLYPASHGQGQSMKERMYFTHLRPDSGSKVYLYQIDGKLQSPNKTLTAKEFSIPHYEVCGNAFQKDPTTGNIDSLSTASAWVQNAFYNHKMVHFTFSADVSNGWCGLHYGRIKLDSNKAVVKSYGLVGTDMSYPAIASFGHDTMDQSVVMAFLKSDSTITPETNVIGVDHDMTFSSWQTVKAGDTVVNILYPPVYPIMPERWGDYTGIARKYDRYPPEAWMAGAYGANTLPRRASYGTWVAQLINNSLPTTTEDVQHKSPQAILYPNPVREMFTVEFENKQYGPVKIILVDMNGKVIRTLFEDNLPESACRLSFNKLMLQPGIYNVQIIKEHQPSQQIKVAIE